MTYTLSPSTLNLYKECHRCFWLQHNKGIRRPAGIFPSLPNGMDSVLKKHFDSFMEKGELPPELKSKGVNAKLFDNKELLKEWRDNRQGLKWKDEKGNILRGAVDNILVETVLPKSPASADLVSLSETQISSPLHFVGERNLTLAGQGQASQGSPAKPGETAGGTCSGKAKAGQQGMAWQGKLIVLDFKTRGYPTKEDTHETYQDQLNIYTFLLQKNGYETEDYAYLLFYHPKEVNANGDVTFHTELKKMAVNARNAEQLFRKAIGVLEGELPKANEECGWCGFVNCFEKY